MGDDANAAAIHAYYQRDEERDRLATGDGLLEFLRTVELIGRTLPPAPAVVADVGGGPGRYVDHLVEQGYRVVLRDLVPGHVDQVRARHLPTDVDAAVADARSLDLHDASVEAVLFLGPLYHLQTMVDRVQALREARRIVKPGGMVYAAAISRSSLRYVALIRSRLREVHPGFDDVVAEAERSGVMPPVTDDSFSGYAHTPDQLVAEVVESGLVCHTVLPVEGPGFAVADLDERLDDAAQRHELLADLAVLEAAPDLLGFTLHLLAVAQRL